MKETIRRGLGATSEPTRADSWDSRYKDRCDDGKTKSGYHGHIGLSLGQQ